MCAIQGCLKPLDMQAAAYLSVNDPIQYMVLSSLGNFSGWSSIKTCTSILHVSKSSPGFPSNRVGSRISIGFANSGCLIHLWRVDMCRPPAPPWSDGGGSGGGSPFPPWPPAAPPSWPPLLPAPPCNWALQHISLSVSLKLDTDADNWPIAAPHWGCIQLWVPGGPAAAWARKGVDSAWKGVDSETLYASIAVVNPVLISSAWASWSSIKLWYWRSSLFVGIFFQDVVIATIALFTSSILRVTVANDFWIVWLDDWTARTCRLLSEILLLNASCSWRIPANKSVASVTIWLSCPCSIWIPDRISCSVACWNCIINLPPDTSESILTNSVCNRLSIIRIPFFNVSNSSSGISFS